MSMPKWWKFEDWIALAVFVGIFLFFAEFTTRGTLAEGAVRTATDPLWWLSVGMGVTWRLMAGSWVWPERKHNR